MTDLLHIIPNFPVNSYEVLIRGLEQHLVTTVDILTLDAVEIHKRTKLGLIDIQRLAAHVTAILQQQLDLRKDNEQQNNSTPRAEEKTLGRTGNDLMQRWSTIGVLDEELDTVLEGGIPTGYITEVTGERGAICEASSIR